MIKSLSISLFMTFIFLFASLAKADEAADLRSLKEAHYAFSDVAGADHDAVGEMFGSQWLFMSFTTAVPIFHPSKRSAVGFYKMVILGPQGQAKEFVFHTRFVDFTVSGDTGIVHLIRQVGSGSYHFYRVMEVWARENGKWGLIAMNEAPIWGPEGVLEAPPRPTPGRPSKAKPSGK